MSVSEAAVRPRLCMVQFMSQKHQRHASCACAAVRGAGRAVTQLYDLVLSPARLKATQFVILHAIAQEGELAQCQLADEYAISVETLSRRLGALRRQGLIQFREEPSHHQRVYSLTEAGQRELQRLLPYWNRAQERLRKALGEAEWEMLFHFCDRLVTAAREAQEIRTFNRASQVIAPETLKPKAEPESQAA
jgi:DNA-binding MarR family transcriptional regulator